MGLALNGMKKFLFYWLLAVPGILYSQHLYLGASVGSSIGMNKLIPTFSFSPSNEQWLVPTLSYGLDLGLEFKNNTRRIELFYGNYNTGMGARIRVAKNGSIGTSSSFTGHLNSLLSLRVNSRLYKNKKYSFWMGVAGAIEKKSLPNIFTGTKSIGGGVVSRRRLTRDSLVLSYLWVPGVEMILGNRFQLSKNWSLNIQAIGHLGLKYYATEYYSSTIDQNNYKFVIQKKGDSLSILIKLEYRLLALNGTKPNRNDE